MRLPGVRRYVQSHTLLSAYGEGEPIYDGIAEVWADDTAALRAMTQSPVHPELVADEARFIDRANMGVIITEDHVIKDGGAATPETAVKRVVFLIRKAGLPVEEFQRHWLEVHGPIAAEIPALRRYVQSHTRLAAYEAGRVPAYDGVAIAWFDSRTRSGPRRPALNTPAPPPTARPSSRRTASVHSHAGARHRRVSGVRSCNPASRLACRAGSSPEMRDCKT